MRFNVDSYLSALKAARKKRRALTASLIVLSIIVSGNVFWFMHGTGIAMADEDPVIETTVTEETGDITEPSEETTEETDIFEETTETEETGSTEDTEETVEPDETEETEPVVFEENEDSEIKTFNAVTENGITVFAHASGEAFPDGTYMTAKYISEGVVLSKLEEDMELDDDKKVIEAIPIDISFFDADGNEIEPSDEHRVTVKISLPDQLPLEGDDLSLVHLDDEGNVSEIQDSYLSQNEANFLAEEFSIYVLTSLGEKDQNYVHEWIEGLIAPERDGYIPNCNDFPYVMDVNDELYLVYYTSDDSRWLFTNQTDIIDIESVESEYNADLQLYRHLSKITPKKEGKVTIAQDAGNWQYEEFFLEVKDFHKTHVINFDDYNFAQYGNPDNAYIVNIGDTIQLIGSSSNPNNYFYLVDGYGQYISYSDYLAISDNEANGSSRTATLDATNPNYSPYIPYYNINNYVGVVIDAGYGDYRTVYFKIQERPMFDHADIEIADGGEYQATKVYIEDDVVKKDVTTYVSAVSKVNDCSLYDEQGQYVTFYKDFGRAEDVLHDVHGYAGDFAEGGDYWKNPNKQPGETQYELTSRYAKDQYGNTIHSSNKKYVYSDVDHVVFDVQLELEPLEKKTYVKNGNDWVLVSTEDISNEAVQYIDSAVFTMDRRDVVDAYNKCPYNNGLDFTIVADMAMVQLEAKKTLVNGTLAGDDYEFELFTRTWNDATGSYDETVICTAKNDADGKVVFSNMIYEEPGTYEYFIREIPGTDPKIDYDDTVYSITIVIGPDMSVDIESGTFNFEFTNKVMFVLPDTGGIGIIPYTLSGCFLISAAVFIYLTRKRKRAGP